MFVGEIFCFCVDFGGLIIGEYGVGVEKCDYLFEMYLVMDFVVM